MTLNNGGGINGVYQPCGDIIEGYGTYQPYVQQTYPPLQWNLTVVPQTPYKCPVCNGTGLVSRPPGVAGDQETWASGSTGPYSCRAGCVSGVLWK
jgi:hypothetical protein